jgi:hypothetical protein
MQPIDLTIVLKDAPRGEWLALSFARDRIVAHALNLTAAKLEAYRLGEPNPIMIKVPPLHALALSPNAMHQGLNFVSPRLSERASRLCEVI